MDKLVYRNIRYLDSGSLLEEEFFRVIVTCCVFSCLACLAVFSYLAIFNLKQKKKNFLISREKENKWSQYLDSDLLLSKGFFETAPSFFVTSVSCLDPGLLDSLISKLGILSLWKAFHKLKFDWIKIGSTWLHYLDSEALLENGFLGTVNSFVLSSSLANSSIIISDNRLPSSLLRSSNFGLSLLWWKIFSF